MDMTGSNGSCENTSGVWGALLTLHNSGKFEGDPVAASATPVDSAVHPHYLEPGTLTGTRYTCGRAVM